MEDNVFQSLIDDFFSLSPYEFTLFGNIIAYFIAASLNSHQQNALGNLLELMAQVLLTIQAQGSQTDITDEELQYFLKLYGGKIRNLEYIVNQLKKD